MYGYRDSKRVLKRRNEGGSGEVREEMKGWVRSSLKKKERKMEIKLLSSFLYLPDLPQEKNVKDISSLTGP